MDFYQKLIRYLGYYNKQINTYLNHTYLICFNIFPNIILPFMYNYYTFYYIFIPEYLSQSRCVIDFNHCAVPRHNIYKQIHKTKNIS